jgi:hypothetical protein
MKAWTFFIFVMWLLFMYLVLFTGCRSGYATLQVEYAVPKEYGTGKIAIQSTVRL